MSTPTTPSNAQLPNNQAIEEVAQQFLSTADEYIRSELSLASSDYDCLRKMNTASLEKYNPMSRTLQRVNNSIRSMNDSNSMNMSTAHAEFHELEEAMSSLEATIKHLDGYSRSLESQVKKFEKASTAIPSKSPRQK